MILILHPSLSWSLWSYDFAAFLTNRVASTALSLGSERNLELALANEVSAEIAQAEVGKSLCVFLLAFALLQFLWECARGRLLEGETGEGSQIIPVVLADAILISNSWVSPGQNCPAKPSWAHQSHWPGDVRAKQRLIVLSHRIWVYHAALLWQ